MLNETHTLESILSKEISDGVVKVIGEEAIISKINSYYPLGLNRIAWEKVPNSTTLNARSLLSPCLSLEELIDKSLSKFADLAMIANTDNVSIVGDGEMGTALEMPFFLARSKFYKITNIPQNTYLVDTTCRWCYVYTLSEYIYYGKSSI